MSATPFADLNALATHLRTELATKKFVLLYAYNGTGKTRLSTAFKDLGKKGDERDTLYFNAFTEDLFSWDNDLDNDRERILKINKDSRFFAGLGELEMDNRNGVLFRGGAEERIRTKLLKDGHIDTVIGLPANLFYSTGIPVCILVLKKCKKPDDVLFINAAEHFVKGKRQNQLTDEHIAKIIDTYQFRREEQRYSMRISMERIATEGYNLNISRYISTAQDEAEIDLTATHGELVAIEDAIKTATAKHNAFLKELGLPALPSAE